MPRPLTLKVRSFLSSLKIGQNLHSLFVSSCAFLWLQLIPHSVVPLGSRDHVAGGSVVAKNKTPVLSRNPLDAERDREEG